MQYDDKSEYLSPSYGKKGMLLRIHNTKRTRVERQAPERAVKMGGSVIIWNPPEQVWSSWARLQDSRTWTGPH